MNDETFTFRRFGDPCLAQPTVPVAPSTDLYKLIRAMKRVLVEQKGLGLAAQQVGSLHRVALVTFERRLLVAINLEILERSKMTTLSVNEGCLSVRVDGRARKKKNCQLGSEHHGEPSVTTVYGVRVCQYHYDMIDDIAANAGRELQRRPRARAA